MKKLRRIPKTRERPRKPIGAGRSATRARDTPIVRWLNLSS